MSCMVNVIWHKLKYADMDSEVHAITHLRGIACAMGIGGKDHSLLLSPQAQGYQHCKLHQLCCNRGARRKMKEERVSSRVEQFSKPGASSAWENTHAPWSMEIGVMVLWKVQVKVSRRLERREDWVQTDRSVRYQSHSCPWDTMKTSFPLHTIVTHMAGSCAPWLWKLMLRGWSPSLKTPLLP